MLFLRTGGLLALMLTGGFLSAHPLAQSGRVSIYVGPQTRDGFIDVDQGILDSIKDIRDELRRSRDFSVVTAREDARIMLLVLGRRIPGTAGAVGISTPGTTFGGGTIAGVPQPTVTAPGVTTPVPIERRAIDTLLKVGTYEKVTTSEDEGNPGSWKSAARQVVKDVTAWVTANRSALRADR